MKVSIFDIVVGDIVQLNIGDQIPADGLLIEGHSMLVDESSMTGESEPVCISLHLLIYYLILFFKLSPIQFLGTVVPTSTPSSINI